jgi:hypothetical protein
MSFLFWFGVALIFWGGLWLLIKRGTETLEDILAKFERNRKR